MDNIFRIVKQGAERKMSDIEFLEREIARWKGSPQRKMQIKGTLYYLNEHDILTRKRTMIGEDGKLQEVENLPNNHVIDNVYAKLVNQKVNYLLGQPLVIDGKNKPYTELLKQIFGRRFMRTLKNAGKAALNGGIAWLYLYYDENGELAFRMFPAYEVLPFWKDSEHTMLEMAVRLYCVESYEGTTLVIVEKAEVYAADGVHRYILDGGKLIPDIDTQNENNSFFYVQTAEAGYNWARIPLIAIKYNESETPLLKKVKSLQDGINVMLSDFENNMQEDARNTILVLVNYDGTDLGEFRRNLATYGAVKVRQTDSAKGGVETLEITVNAENYKTIIDIFRKAVIENGMGYDSKDERLSGTPNQMNIQSMYSDIDLDANDMETELQAAFEELLWFVNAHLANTGQGSFENEDVTVIFNRDMMMDEGQIVENIRNSEGILSRHTLVAQHPWVDDVEEELRLIAQEEKEEAQATDVYSKAFPVQEQDEDTA